MYAFASEILSAPESDLTYSVDRAKCVGRVKTMPAIARAMAARNCKNRIGNVDYNLHGIAGHPTIPLSSIFCDNFCLKFPVSREEIRKGGSEPIYEACGSTNTRLREILKKAGMRSPNGNPLGWVKGLSLTMPKDGGQCYQTYKVACADEDLEKILQFLHKDGPLSETPFRLADIDITQDFSGTLHREKLEEHLVSELGFRLQGDSSSDPSLPTILDNAAAVGKNCLTYMRTNSAGTTTRGKFYNKFAQSLESASVRSANGNHIWDWCNNPEDRLRATIAKSLPTGLTRLEITLYGGCPPTMEQVAKEIEWAADCMHPSAVYETPIAKQWESFATHIERNTVVYCPETHDVVFALWHNEITGRLAGFHKSLEDPIRELPWILSELTLDKDIDVLYLRWDLDEEERLDQIRCGVRTFSKHLRDGKICGTRLTTKNKLYKSAKDTTYLPMEDFVQPEERGLVPSNGISFYVATRAANKHSAGRYDLQEVFDAVVRPNVLSDKTKHKEAMEESIELAERLDATDANREAIAEEKIRMQEMERQKEEDREGLYRNLFDVPLNTLDKEKYLGRSFDVYGIGVGKNPRKKNGTYYVLWTTRGAFVADSKIANEVIPDLLNPTFSYLQMLTHRKRTMYYRRDGEKIFSFRVVGWSPRRCKKTGTQLTVGESTTKVFAVNTERTIRFEDVAFGASNRISALERESLLQPVDYDGPLTKLVKLESLPPCTRIRVVGWEQKSTGKREVDIFRGDDGVLYRGNDWTKKRLGERKKPPSRRFTIVTDQIRNTASKTRHMDVKIIC